MPRVLQAARREWIALLILFFGGALRLWQLGEFPFHPDEAIHAWFAENIRTYSYDPVYHGPLLYHLGAGVFAVFGASDFTARFVPALLGVLLLWMMLFPVRQFLGLRGALWGGVLLALSPVVAAYSRRLLHDSLVLALTLGAVLCFQAALDNPSTSRAGRNARIGLASILTLFLATKANVFFIGAMLFAFWIWHFLTQQRTEKKKVFEWQTPLLAASVAVALFVLLFRTATLSAIPAMIDYWGGQQREPRLPGPHDYYFRLLLLYELPLFLSAIWGAWYALTRRTPFTNLLLWWAFTSLVFYAIANEKVPWLLTHQVLPLSLLAGYGLAQVAPKTITQRAAWAGVLLLAAVFSLRHVAATNWEPAAGRHEPLFFAQTTESYRDTLFSSLASTRGAAERNVWVQPDQQWPAAWYLREGAPALEGSEVLWGASPPPESTLRLALLSPKEWQSLQARGRFADWNMAAVERYVWPRPAWSALAPQRFARFWLRRDASLENGVLSEQSSAVTVFSVPGDSPN